MFAALRAKVRLLLQMTPVVPSLLMSQKYRASLRIASLALASSL